jgi:tetratricopeptide (TPR) repeat protein
MLSDDYLVRKIMQFASVIAKIIGLKMSGQFQEALEVIDQSLGQLLGINADIADFMDDESLYKVLTKDEVIDFERLGIIADLFKEKGDILYLQKQKPEGDTCYLRSMNYYLMMSNTSEASQQNELPRKIEELINILENYKIPEITLFNIFCYYENEGKYSKAENILERLAAYAKADTGVRNEMITFYTRLLSKSPLELSAGGMNIKRIRLKLKDLDDIVS